MFLRRQPCRSSITTRLSASRNLSTRGTATRHSSPRVQFTYWPAARPNHHEAGKQPKQASIRPITLFAICVPLGYAVSYALKTREDSIEADGFVKYALVKKEEVSSTCSIFTLRPTTPAAVLSNDVSSPRIITSVQFKQPQLQIARSYTLLPPLQGQDANELRFLIRKERNGEVSGYLHRLPLGSELELRGLSAEYILPEKVDKVVFLAGGTGIAPAMQVADALAGQANVHILWASRLREDCAGGRNDTDLTTQSGNGHGTFTSLFGMLRQKSPTVEKSPTREESLVVAQLEFLKQLYDARSSGRNCSLKVDYFVDEEGSFIQTKDVSRLLRLGDLKGDDKEKRLLFVAGPDGFVNYWAATKIWVNGQEMQGSVGGALSRMNLAGWEVVKL